jgi:hypothetical protein
MMYYETRRNGSPFYAPISRCQQKRSSGFTESVGTSKCSLTSTMDGRCAQLHQGLSTEIRLRKLHTRESQRRIWVGEDIAKTSKNTLKSCPFPKRRWKTLKCARLFHKMGPFRKNRSKDVHYRFRIGHSAVFSQKDLQFCLSFTPSGRRSGVVQKSSL